MQLKWLTVHFHTSNCGQYDDILSGDCVTWKLF